MLKFQTFKPYMLKICLRIARIHLETCLFNCQVKKHLFRVQEVQNWLKFGKTIAIFVPSHAKIKFRIFVSQIRWIWSRIFKRKYLMEDLLDSFWKSKIRLVYRSRRFQPSVPRVSSALRCWDIGPRTRVVTQKIERHSDLKTGIRFCQ